MTITLPAAAARPGPAAAAAAEVTLAWGEYVPFGAPNTWAEIDPASPMTAAVTSDQPGVATARSISASDYGVQCAILSGVPAGVAVDWEVVPDVAASGPKVLVQVAGPALIMWFTYVGGPHAAGTYSVTATVDGQAYGPIVLTVT